MLESLPVGDTKTASCSGPVTTHGSVGAAFTEWQSPSQRKKLLLHESPHDPLAHVALPPPLAGPGHVVQCVPQCAGSSGLTHCPPQETSAELQELPQTPATHVAVAFAGTGQAPQVGPQWLGSVLVSKQPPSQSSPPSAHAGTHEPPEHATLPPAGATHSNEHEPQCATEVAVSTHPASSPQYTVPEAQAAPSPC